jgi:hypothetical protein
LETAVVSSWLRMATDNSIAASRWCLPI